MTIRARAFLRLIRNHRQGLITRSSIIEKLDLTTGARAREIAATARLRYGTVLHHLRLMRVEGIVRRLEEGRWVITELGQQSMEEYMDAGSRRHEQRT